MTTGDGSLSMLIILQTASMRTNLKRCLAETPIFH